MIRRSKKGAVPVIRGTLPSDQRPDSKNPAAGFPARGLCSGDVLLSHNLSSHYHRGCSVSLPCSEWERAAPLRYYHQNRTPKLLGTRFWLCLRFEVRGLIFQSNIKRLPSNIQRTPIL